MVADSAIAVVDLLGPQTVNFQGSENANEKVKSVR